MNRTAHPEFGLPRVRLPLAWACATAAVLAAAFLFVHGSLSRDQNAPADWRAAQRAREFDRLMQSLNALLHEIELAPPRDSVADRVRWETWVEHHFRPRVSEFRQQLLASPLEGPAYAALLRAGDRLGALAASPGDERALELARAGRDAAQTLVQPEMARTQSR